MIEFKRNGTDVIIKVDSNLNVKKPIYLFTYFCEDENEAELLINHLQSEYKNMLIEYYNSGEAKGKESGHEWGYREAIAESIDILNNTSYIKAIKELKKIKKILYSKAN